MDPMSEKRISNGYDLRLHSSHGRSNVRLTTLDELLTLVRNFVLVTPRRLHAMGSPWFDWVLGGFSAIVRRCTRSTGLYGWHLLP